VQTDRDVAAILERLEREGIADETVVFFWTDHGVSHLRGKQFLYEEGIHVPLIVRFPDRRGAGTVRKDLATHIDVAATSLALAQIAAPEYIQGVDLFAADYRPRDRIFAARDRCDETVEIIRCVRTPRFKYIRNFLPHLPHAQPNQYKDGKQIVQTMRRLHAEGRLSELQGRPFLTPRPREELYDLEHDPHELVNLADDPAYAERLRGLRRTLSDWMQSSGDLGIIPEPVLEELGRAAGNKYFVLRDPSRKHLVGELLSLIEAADAGDMPKVIAALSHESSAMRYWAATRLGLQGDRKHLELLAPLTSDPDGGVRVAAALARCRIDATPQDVALLAEEVGNENRPVGMYAIRALELIGPEIAATQAGVVRAAQQSPYEFTRRIARRLNTKLGELDR
jgi:hypothetical protein